MPASVAIQSSSVRNTCATLPVIVTRSTCRRGSVVASPTRKRTASAPGYGLVHAELARLWHAGEGRLRGFARIDNVFDRQHIGSVIVNEGNGRYYEPGPGRAVLLGLEWQLR